MFLSENALRRHRSNKHTANSVVKVKDVMYPVASVDGRYCCPIGGCNKSYEGIDGLRKHAKDRHSGCRDSASLAPPVKRCGPQAESTHVSQGLPLFLRDTVLDSMHQRLPQRQFWRLLCSLSQEFQGIVAGTPTRFEFLSVGGHVVDWICFHHHCRHQSNLRMSAYEIYCKYATASWFVAHCSQGCWGQW